MSKEREMIEKLCSFQMTYSDWLLLIADAEELLDQPEQESVEDRIARWHRLGYAQGKKASKREAQPEQEQEPVVWGSFNFNNECVGTGSKRIAAQIQKNNKIYPLYTSPLKREPLTDESICEILLKKEWFGFIELVRMIEKAHGIGGGE